MDPDTTAALHTTFRQATSLLLDAGFTLREISEALGASYAAVKQARMDPGHVAFREPPKGWTEALTEMVSERVERLETLEDRLRKVEEHERNG